ncbi:AAA family ATPase [Pimelobacter simplex]|uniref:AAA family ATPase n=1 Tax=Nocardioides simplex TaxID=2045 RepID=UPI003AAD6B86
MSKKPSADRQFDAAVASALRKLEVNERARHLRREANADEAFTKPDSHGRLDDLLRKKRQKLAYTIDRLHPAGSNSLIAAQYKVGKTTLMVNLLKAYADAEPFLGDFKVEPGGGRIALFNYELTEDMLLDDYLIPLGIENPDRVAVVNLRGRNFDLRSPAAFKWAAKWLRKNGCDALILDPFGAAARLNNENDNSEARNWLLGVLDPLKEEAGVRDLWMPAHTGRGEAEEGNEHVRGASAVDDWADVRWNYAKAQIPGKHGPVWRRFLSANGRGVDVAERELAFDPEDHWLYVTEQRSRAKARSEVGARTVQAIVEATPDLNATALWDALPMGNRAKGSAVKEAVRLRLIHVIDGPNRSKLHRPGPSPGASDA